MNDSDSDDMVDRENVDIIVRAVLDELRGEKQKLPSSHVNNKQINQETIALEFSKEIQNYMALSHSKNNNFEDKMKKLIKSVCEADKRYKSSKIYRYRNCNNETIL